jgi:arylformamidase
MKHFLCVLLVAVAAVSGAVAQQVARDVPYAPAHPRQVLDVHAPAGAKNLPVVFWIHGGGWQTGDKSMVALKPKAFMDAGYVFVSINHRLLPAVDMGAITRDVASALGCVHCGWPPCSKRPGFPPRSWLDARPHTRALPTTSARPTIR